MSGRGSDGLAAGEKELKYAQPASANSAETLEVFAPGLAQRSASQSARSEYSELGAPMTIREVARMFGCSVWTIRQRYLPLGLPHFRLRPTGKILLFHNQIVRWVLAQQRKKGGIRL